LVNINREILLDCVLHKSNKIHSLNFEGNQATLGVPQVSKGALWQIFYLSFQEQKQITPISPFIPQRLKNEICGRKTFAREEII
jgi:hypothetical protein